MGGGGPAVGGGGKLAAWFGLAHAGAAKQPRPRLHRRLVLEQLVLVLQPRALVLLLFVLFLFLFLSLSLSFFTSLSCCPSPSFLTRVNSSACTFCFDDAYAILCEPDPSTARPFQFE